MCFGIFDRLGVVHECDRQTDGQTYGRTEAWRCIAISIDIGEGRLIFTKNVYFPCNESTTVFFVNSDIALVSLRMCW